MRGAFGLLSLLMVVAIVLYLLGGRGCSPGGRSYIQTVTDVKKEKEPLAQQWGGKDPTGRPFHESLTLADWPEQGALRGVRVETIEAAGIAATHFGLRQGDVITHIGAQPVGGFVITDASAANDFLDDAFARSASLTVRRGDAELTLPQQGGTPAATTPGLGTGVGLPPGLPGLPSPAPGN